MITRTFLGTLFIIIFTLASFSPTFATESRNYTDGKGIITFQGQIITKEALSHLMNTWSIHCHDAAGASIVHCFSTSAQAENSLRQFGVHITIGNNSAIDSPATNISTLNATLGCAYVTLYDGIDLTGTSYTLCTDRPNLADIGWDERTESFKTYSSVTTLCTQANYALNGSCLEAQPTEGGVADLSTFLGGVYYQTISSVKKGPRPRF